MVYLLRNAQWIYLFCYSYINHRNLLKHTSITDAFFQHAAMIKDHNDQHHYQTDIRPMIIYIVHQNTLIPGNSRLCIRQSPHGLPLSQPAHYNDCYWTITSTKCQRRFGFVCERETRIETLAPNISER